MRNIVNYIKYLCLSLFVLSLNACMDDPGTDIVFGETFVEINEASLATSNTTTRIYKRTDNGITVKDSLTINLVGAHRSSAISVSYKLSTGGTGVKDTHFKITDGTVSIPANASFAKIPFEIIDDVIEPGEIFTFIVELTSADVPLSKNYSKVTFRFTTECPFDVNTFVGNYSCQEPGYGGSPYDVTFTKGTGNTIVINNFWDFGGVVTYTFSGSTVTIAQQTVSMGGEPWIVAGSGTFNTCTGRMIVNYTVDRVSDGLRYDTNTHTFTKK